MLLYGPQPIIKMSFQGHGQNMTGNLVYNKAGEIVYEYNSLIDKNIKTGKPYVNMYQITKVPKKDCQAYRTV